MKIIIAMVAGLVALGLGFGARYAIESSHNPPNAEPAIIQPVTPPPAVPAPIVENPTPVPTSAGPVDCGTFEGGGTIGDKFGADATVEQQCFDKLFKACTPAILKVSLGQGVIKQYRILGRASADDCTEDVQFIANPMNPQSLKNPPLSCSVDSHAIGLDSRSNFRTVQLDAVTGGKCHLEQ